jgi:SAM-dependent methyltransferase
MTDEEYQAHFLLEDRHWWFVSRRDLVSDILTREVPPDSGHRVVEVGCGTGGNLAYFRDRYMVEGVEVSAVAAELARRKAGCEVHLGEVDRLTSLEWEGVRGVLLLDVLEHVRDDRELLGKILERLSPGSCLLLTVPASPGLWSRHDETLGHYRRYSRAGLADLLKGWSAETVLVRSLFWTVFPAAALYRLSLGRIRGAGASDLATLPRAVNILLEGTVSMERLFIRWLPVPWGLSHLALLRRK